MSGPPESRPPYTDAGPGRREEPPVPASPADPASRRAAASMSPSGTPYDTEPGRRGSGPAGAPYGTEPGRRGSGPAGAPYGTEPGRRGSGPPARPFDAERERPDARPPLPYSDERAARAASPSGSRYDDLPGGPPAERRPYLTPPAADRPADPYAEPAYRRPGNGQQSRPPAPGWQDSGWHDQGGWPAADQPSRRADEQGSGWPEQAQQPGWPQGSEPGSGAGPAWHVPGQSEWPEQEGTLEALPPPGEVHHDWPASNDRPRRGWLAPEDETDGETW
jgi:hypothetical protein